MTYTESFSETLSESVVREPWDVTEGAVSQGVSNPAHCSTMHFLWMVFTHSGRETHNLETDLSSAQPHDLGRRHLCSKPQCFSAIKWELKTLKIVSPVQPAPQTFGKAQEE